MNKNKLSLTKPSTYLFLDYIKTSLSFSNLFVLTHLGQLKQMEALISSKGMNSNCLVVLYTEKNLIVPQSVHDQYSELFDIAIFLEIPFGVNKTNYLKLKKTERIYQKLISKVQPQNLYLNSFEGHYAVLISIAKKRSIRAILVEEGTATYKLNQTKMIEDDSKKDLGYDFVREKFMSTVGQTQVFKKFVKMHKYNLDLYKQSRTFFKEVVKDERFQKSLIQVVGDQHIKASLEPFKDFDQAYASFPNLIKGSFGIKNVDYFLIHEVVNEDSIRDAQEVVELYDISSNDILFVSQRYHLDSKQYVDSVTAILSRMALEDQTVFIKLHPKESRKTYDAFKYIEFVSNQKFIVIEESQFLIESVIRVSKVQQLIGLTSTTLVYGPLISPSTRSISIAEELINLLSGSPKNNKGIETIKQHLDIIKVFDNIEFR